MRWRPGLARRSRTRRQRLRAGLSAPLTALRRTARDPSTLRLQLAWAAVMTASWVTTVSVTVVAYDAGGSPAVALAVLARTAPGAVLGPAVGALVDRGPKHRSLVWAAATSSAASVGAAVAGSAVVPVVLLATVVALATIVFRAAQSAILPELVEEPSELTAANVLSSAVEALGVFVGPAAAGLLLAVQGVELTFGVAAAMFAAASLALVRLESARRPPEAPREVTRARNRELLGVGAARLLLLLVLAQTTVAGGLVVLYAALAVQALDAGVGAVGVLNSAFGLGGVVGSLCLFALAGSSRLGLFTAWALALWAVPLLLVPLAPGLVVVLLLLAVVGVGNVLFDVTTVTLLQRGVPQHLLGRAFGLLETVVVLGLGLGAVLASPLEALAGPEWAVVALAAPLAVVALGSGRSLRRLDRELAAPARQVALLRALAPFALLSPPALEGIALRLVRRALPAGAVVVRQGEPGHTYFVVDSGSLSVTVDDREVSSLGPGNAFGEIALLRGGTRTATITTRTPTVLWELEGAVFVAAMHADGGRALAAADEVVHTHLQRAAPAGGPPGG